MSEFTLGERYGSEDMYRDFPDLKRGDRVTVERNGVIYTDTIESVRYRSGVPAIYRDLNRWQRFLRKLTPSRRRKSLLVRGAELPSVTINSPDQSPVGKTIAQLEEMKGVLGRFSDDQL